MDPAYFIHILKKAGDKWRRLRNDTTRLKESVLKFDNDPLHFVSKQWQPVSDGSLIYLIKISGRQNSGVLNRS